jgi:prefoldin subunit 5
MNESAQAQNTQQRVELLERQLIVIDSKINTLQQAKANVEQELAKLKAAIQ